MTGRPGADTNSPAACSPPSRLPLIAAAALAACWLIALFALSIFTANPVTLNRDQILRADDVVTATLATDPASKDVHVQREWKNNALTGTVRVDDLPTVSKRLGVAYIIPLSRIGNSFQITKKPPPNGPPLIYPENPDTIDQLEAILSSDADGKKASPVSPARSLLSPAGRN